MRRFNKHIGGKTFEHCRIPLKVTGADLSTGQIIVFESGLITEAVRASIADPAIFKPVFIKGDLVVDGGILSPLPVRVLHDAGVHKIIAVNVFPSAKDSLERHLLKEEAEEKETALVGQKIWPVRAAFHTKRYLAHLFSPNVFDILMNTIQCMESEIAEIEGSPLMCC